MWNLKLNRGSVQKIKFNLEEEKIEVSLHWIGHCAFYTHSLDKYKVSLMVDGFFCLFFR